MKRGFALVAIGFILNVLESWYFGWNLTAQTTTEGFSDMICILIIFSGYVVCLKSKRGELG